jgi:DNA (cytosine-5)-methyltransferase 1
MSRPRLLDLFCGAGGAAMGYHRAGFDVVGVDIKPQPRYPFTFAQMDAMEVLRELTEAPPNAYTVYDAIHASPPCQAFSVASKVHGRSHPDLITPLRPLLQQTGLPWVIENVPGAPLEDPVLLCGSMVGLDLQRHRLFECSFPVLVPSCHHGWQLPRFPPNRSGRRGRLARVISVVGHGGPRADAAEGGGKAKVEEWRRVMEIPWMTRNELAEAVPPAYTELIGHQLLRLLPAREEALA